jgi:hypothetical protein
MVIDTTKFMFIWHSCSKITNNIDSFQLKSEFLNIEQ